MKLDLAGWACAVFGMTRAAAEWAAGAARSLSVLALLVIAAPAAFAGEAPAPKWGWSSEALTGSLFKPGKNQVLYFGARMQGVVSTGLADIRLHGRVEAGATTDGGAVDVSLENPQSFQTLEGYVAASRPVWGPLSAVVLWGLQVDVEGGRIKPMERYPIALAGGVRGETADGVLTGYVLAGRHDAAGSGFAVLFSGRARVEARTSLVVDGAIGKGSFARLSMARELGGSPRRD